MIEIFNQISDLEQSLTPLNADKLFVVIDKKVSVNFPSLKTSLEDKAEIYLELEVNEDLKSFKSFQFITESILEKGITRNSLIIAIGGGTLSDICGFAASVLLRGVPWICVPTTLLSMVDAGIGGKTGIDTHYGKNLIGSFHSPIKVLLYRNFLDTLPEKDMASGYGEIVKYGLLSQDIAQAIGGHNSLDVIIDLCSKYKLKVTQDDFYDRGIRKFLNLGHTLGHAIEIAHSMPHGIGVFWGIYWEHRLFGFHHTAMKTLELARQLNVVFKPKVLMLNSDELWKYIRVDKKMASSTQIEIPLINDEGHSILIKTELADLKNRMDNSKGTLFA